MKLLNKYLNKIILEDCMNILKKLPDKSIDLGILDPPYGIGQDWKKRKKSKYFETSYKNNDIPSKEYFDEINRVCKNYILWGANYFTEYIKINNNLIIWNKKTDYKTSFGSEGELAWTTIKKYPLRIYDHMWSGARKETETGKKKIHPHQKPVNLYRWLLQQYAEPEQIILDTHSGSGSCAIACYLENFNFISIEKDFYYWKESSIRLKKEKNQLKLF